MVNLYYTNDYDAADITARAERDYALSEFNVARRTAKCVEDVLRAYDSMSFTQSLCREEMY